MTRTALLLLLTAAACAHAPPASDRSGAASRTDAGPAGPPAGAAEKKGASEEPRVPRAAVLEHVAGIVRAVDRKAHTLTVQAPGGAVTLSLDRNTMVYTANGLGTVLDLVPGADVRAGRNADQLAYWVQVRGPAGPEPSPTRGQGTGPGGGTPPPPERGAAPGGSAPPSPISPGTGPATRP